MGKRNSGSGNLMGMMVNQSTTQSIDAELKKKLIEEKTILGTSIKKPSAVIVKNGRKKWIPNGYQKYAQDCHDYCC